MNPAASYSTLEALDVLARSDDRELLEAAGVCLAQAGDPGAVRALGQLLAQRDFLARLDDVGDPQENMLHLERILAAIGGNPTQHAGAILVGLARSPDFLEIDERRIPLLSALGAVRPMTGEGAAVVRQAAAEGYYSTVIPLLIENSSPRALALLEELILDPQVDPESRASDLHSGLLPHRIEVAVLHSVERLLAQPLEPRVERGLLETIFEHRSREWFGPAINPPRPPPWEEASTEALRQVLHLAQRARSRGLSAELSESVER